MDCGGDIGDRPLQEDAVLHPEGHNLPRQLFPQAPFAVDMEGRAGVVSGKRRKPADQQLLVLHLG